ncbi:MAG: lipopolysaccharide transport system ATP-binding protein [Salibacteraceae bacterium]|jgi:lipopolysaccharide transport system ATP-binding protein
MSDVAIKVENLWKRYQIGQQKSTSFRESMNNVFSKKGEDSYFWALRELDFEIKQGEAVGIIGKNGAGKSTLLKVLSKITYPTKGRIEINGRVSSLLEVGTGFHPELTGRQNIFLNGTILGMKRWEINEKFDEIVAFSGVEKFIDTAVKHYSSGMKVRLAFSVAAHLEPQILIIDEVLAVGDAEFQKKCLGKMEDVTGKGRTVLFVSHNMGAIETLCKRGLHLEKGKLEFAGTQREAINYYLRKSQNIQGLAERIDRKGDGSLRICDVFISDQENHKLEQVQTGQNLLIHFIFECKEMIIHPVITLHIYDDQDACIFMVHSRMTKNIFNKINGTGSFICNIKKLALPPGNYYLSYTVIEDGKYIDGLDYVMKMEVIHGDFYGSGEIPNSSQSKVILDADWKLE